MKSGIYKIKNLLNNKAYIGSAKELNRRKKTHFTQLAKGTHHNIHLQSAYDKYNKDVFEFEILEYCSNDELISREQFWIDSFEFEDLYNICPKAYSRLGTTLSQEHKDNIGKRSLERICSPETKLKISTSLLGHSVSKEAREKISRAHQGRPKGPMSDETKQKISEKNKGKVRTEEMNMRSSEAHKGFKVSEETKKKISLSSKGIKKPLRSTEHADKIREANTGKKATDDIKNKISIGVKLSWSQERKLREKEKKQGKPWSEARRLAQEKKE